MSWLLNVLLAALSRLVPAPHRAEWRREWYAELWFHWFRTSARDTFSRRIAALVRGLTGCWTDAFWLRRADCDMPAGRRWPDFVWLGWPAAALLCLFARVAIHAPLATPQLIQTLVASSRDTVAVVSLERGLTAARSGFPPDLVDAWRTRSRWLSGLAVFSPLSRAVIGSGSSRRKVTILNATPNLFDVLEPGRFSRPPGPSVVLSYRLSRRLPHSAQRVTLGAGSLPIAAILPEGCWFISPAVDIYVLNSVPRPELLLVRTQNPVTATILRSDLTSVAAALDMPFASSSPRVLPLADSCRAPFDYFGLGVLLAYLLTLTRLRLPRCWTALNRALVRLAQYGLVLASVLFLGIELVVGSGQMWTEPLGGPQLLWFYLVACTLAFRSLGSGRRHRCRICFQVLAMPVSIGTVGPVLLDWSGTELVCPRDHGLLCVPFYRASWQRHSYWIQAWPDIAPPSPPA